VVLNAATGKGDFASLFSRFRHWSRREDLRSSEVQ
jgi:hypothetical protein